MATLFFSLRGVPADEADDVRQLLAGNDIAFYETLAGNWGISMPAIWLYHREDLEQAQRLFDQYQEQRALTQRALHQQLKSQGRYIGFWRHNLNNPLRFIAYSAIVGLIFYLSLKWLFELGF